MAGIVFGLGVTAAACHLPRVPEHRRRQHPPVPERRLGDPLFTAEEPECELWQARQSDPSARAASKEKPFLAATQIDGSECVNAHTDSRARTTIRPSSAARIHASRADWVPPTAADTPWGRPPRAPT
jgi:hypothetical protein